jgi:hypothetical protein
MIETDAEIWTVNGSGTGAMIDTRGQSVTEIGIDGEIESVRLVQVDETATVTTVIASIVTFVPGTKPYARLVPTYSYSLYRVASHCYYLLYR